MAAVLIIDDEEVFARNTAKYLEKCGHAATVALTGQDGLAACGREAPDLILLDYRLPDLDGLEMIARLRQLDAVIPIVMITGHGSIELAVEAMKAGANDLLTKPVSLAELRQRVERFAAEQRHAGRLDYFERQARQSAQTLIGDSQAMRDLRQRLERIAAIDGDQLPPVLILGETGTGKELIARALHFDGRRADQPFIELNCAAIPDHLLESELFGHERGAFTDAKERKIGLLEAADGGTLFLDEIGEMNLALQAKLLKVIEDGRFRRLGALQERQVNLRIVAATHQDLDERIRQGSFRADLYFRLRVLQVSVPPLRERADDALGLARHFLGQFARRYHKAGLHLGAAAEAAIRAHHWPGNVRELRNVMEQAVLLCPDREIGAADLMLPTARQTVESSPGTPVAADSSSRIEQMERSLLVQALEQVGGNVSGAARALGISRDTLRYRMEKYGLRHGK